MYTQEQVREALVSVIMDEPLNLDYVYPPAIDSGGLAACSYVDEFGGCLIGRMARKLDPDAQLEEGKSAGATDWVQENIGDEADANLADALNEAQSAQDDGKTWGEALEAFDSYMEFV